RFAWHLDALLNDIRFGKRGVNRLLPCCIVHSPAEHNALAAILVVWLEHEMFTIVGNEWHEVDVASAMLCATLFNESGPRDMCRNGSPLIAREERLLAFIAHHRKRGL